MFYIYGARIRAKCKYAADAEKQMAMLMAARMAQSKRDEESSTEAKAPAPAADQEKTTPATATETEAEKLERFKNHHEWSMYEVLADRDEVDLSDDERIRLQDPHKKFQNAKAKRQRSMSLKRSSSRPNLEKQVE